MAKIVTEGKPIKGTSREFWAKDPGMYKNGETVREMAFNLEELDALFCEEVKSKKWKN